MRQSVHNRVTHVVTGTVKIDIQVFDFTVFDAMLQYVTNYCKRQIT